MIDVRLRPKVRPYTGPANYVPYQVNFRTATAYLPVSDFYLSIVTFYIGLSALARPFSYAFLCYASTTYLFVTYLGMTELGSYFRRAAPHNVWGLCRSLICLQSPPVDPSVNLITFSRLQANSPATVYTTQVLYEISQPELSSSLLGRYYRNVVTHWISSGGFSRHLAMNSQFTVRTFTLFRHIIFIKVIFIHRSVFKTNESTRSI